MDCAPCDDTRIIVQSFNSDPFFPLTLAAPMSTFKPQPSKPERAEVPNTNTLTASPVATSPSPGTPAQGVPGTRSLPRPGKVRLLQVNAGSGGDDGNRENVAPEGEKKEFQSLRAMFEDTKTESKPSKSKLARSYSTAALTRNGGGGT